MILGIGTDMVEISRIEHILKSGGSNEPFLQRTFTESERLSAPEAPKKRYEYFATRFAAKEAVFKALAHLTAKKTFDLRMVETLNYDDGSPYVNITEPLHRVLKEAKVHTLHISFTTEGGLAAAFVVAEG